MQVAIKTKHQSWELLALCEGNPPTDCSHKGPVIRKVFSCNGYFMRSLIPGDQWHTLCPELLHRGWQTGYPVANFYFIYLFVKQRFFIGFKFHYNLFLWVIGQYFLTGLPNVESLVTERKSGRQGRVSIYFKMKYVSFDKTYTKKMQHLHLTW